MWGLLIRLAIRTVWPVIYALVIQGLGAIVVKVYGRIRRKNHALSAHPPDNGGHEHLDMPIPPHIHEELHRWKREAEVLRQVVADLHREKEHLEWQLKESIAAARENEAAAKQSPERPVTDVS